jgi:hypothetical protein
MSLRNRLRRLEVDWNPPKFDWARWRADREREWLDAAEQLLELLPESRRAAVAKLVKPGVESWVPWEGHPESGYFIPCPVMFDNPGLQHLLIVIWNRLWENPTPIPECLVDAYLSEPRLSSNHRCKGCRGWMPCAPGYWQHESEPGRWWQGPLVPFRDCPACGANFWDGGPGYFLPTAPTPGWRFETSIPGETGAG